MRYVGSIDTGDQAFLNIVMASRVPKLEVTVREGDERSLFVVLDYMPGVCNTFFTIATSQLQSLLRDSAPYKFPVLVKRVSDLGQNHTMRTLESYHYST